MKNLDTYLSEGFYKNTGTDICGTLNSHILHSAFGRYRFEQDRGKIYLCIESINVGSFGTFRNIRVEINKRDVDSIYKIIAGTERVIYIEPTVFGVPDKKSMRVIVYIRCYENEHDAFWGGRVIERTFKTDKTLSSDNYEIDEGFYSNTHTRVVDQLNDKRWSDPHVWQDGNPDDFYFDINSQNKPILCIREILVKNSPYKYVNIELPLYDTEFEQIVNLLQSASKPEWRVEYAPLGKDKYTIMFKFYDSRVYIYHVKFILKPQEMIKYKVNRGYSLNDFVK